MRTRGDIFLLVFLAFGILFYLLTIQFAGDSSINSSRNSLAKGTDTLRVSPSRDTTQVLHRGSFLENYDLKEENATRWKLPKRLREISGLAMTHDNRLLAHNDEKAIIYEIDYRNGSTVKAFGLGDLGKPVAGDFEGIAAVDSLIYLVTSSGWLYECSEGANGETVLFNVYSTGVGRDFEIESLAYEPSQRALLLMSKNPRSVEHEGQLVVYRWSIDTKQLIENGHTIIPVTDFSRHIKGKKFQPSGIERHPVSGNYFVVAARQGAIAEITPSGQVMAVLKFPAEWHRQIEGITFAQDQALIVSDEGAGKHARLTLYPILSN